MFRFLAIPATLLLFASCQEKGPFIDFKPVVKDTATPVDPRFRAFDTTYSADVETPQARIVLVEEFTGVTCPQCPAGHQALKSILQANPGRVAVVGIQPIGNAQSRPYDKDGVKTRHDNRTQAGTDIGSSIYGGIGSLPQAGIDRIPDAGFITGLFGRNDWSSTVENRKGVATKANINVESIYVDSSRKAAITVTVAYTSDVSLPQKLTVAITENKVIDVQELATSEKHDEEYDHEHVLRDILTTSTGSEILKTMSPIVKGQVYRRTFVYTIPEGWNPANCNVVAYVANADPSSQEVLQAAEKALK